MVGYLRSDEVLPFTRRVDSGGALFATSLDLDMVKETTPALTTFRLFCRRMRSSSENWVEKNVQVGRTRLEVKLFCFNGWICFRKAPFISNPFSSFLVFEPWD